MKSSKKFFTWIFWVSLAFSLLLIFTPFVNIASAGTKTVPQPQKTAPSNPAPKKPAPPRKTKPITPEKLNEEANKAPAAAPNPEAIPQARIEEAEQAFTRAWQAFTERNYWQALTQLDKAQAANIFLVDVYYLRALVQRKMGDFDAAQKSISGFIEVRPRDQIAPFILQETLENRGELLSVLSTVPYPTNWIAQLVDIYSVFKLLYNRPYSAKGFGKLDGFGSDLCFADTIGNRIYTRMERKSGGFLSVPINSPVVGLMPGDGSIFVLNVSGDVYKVEDASADIIGNMEDTSVADAAYLSGEEIIVCDPLNRRVALYLFPALDMLDIWAPDNAGEYLFEPVAVDTYGEWAAIADRANGRIHFLNLRNYTSFFSEEKSVRDVLWSGLGSLISVNDNSEIAVHSVDFGKKTVVREILRKDAQHAWALFKYENEIFCSDILGSKLWQIKANPTINGEAAYLSLYYPKIEADADGNENLSMNGTLTTPFQASLSGSSPVAMSVWNENIITTSINMLEIQTPHTICFARGSSGEISSNTRVIPAETCSEIYSKFAPIWETQRDLLTNVIVDSRIRYDAEDLKKLTGFFLFNGLQMDVWARSIPSFDLLRASAATSGRVYYSLSGQAVFSNLQNRLRATVVLPFKAAASGYSDRATLSMYMSIKQLSARDWMPIWIDLIKK